MGPCPVIDLLIGYIESPRPLNCLILFQYSLSFGVSNSLSFDMTNRLGLGSASSPPYPRASVYYEFEAPPPEAFLAPLQLPQAHPQPLPQAVVVEEAPADDLDSTLEFFIEEDPEIASNAIVLVDAQTQVSRPPSRPGSARASPRPVIGLRISGVIEALVTAAAPVYAARSPRASPPPPPPPAYADSAARVVRRPPNALLVQRLRTRSSAGDGPLFEPLISDSRCSL